MSRIKYVHVYEYEDGTRLIAPGKGDREGANVVIPTPENDREEFERREWERVDYWELPEPMAKSDFIDWWNTTDDDVEPIPQVLEAMDASTDRSGGDDDV